MNFTFLKNIELVEAKEKATKSKSAVSTVPGEGAHIRLFKNGAMYPSQELVDRMHLEYITKKTILDAEGNMALAMDVIDSRNSHHYPQDAEQHVLMVAFVPKSSPKVDVFGSVGYYTAEDVRKNELLIQEGKGNPDVVLDEPKKSVLTQGSSTFGASLIPILNQLYGKETSYTTAEGTTATGNLIEFIDDKYVDLTILLDSPLVVANNIYMMPKKVTKGPKAGTVLYERRENIEGMFPIVLTSDLMDSTEVQDTEVVEDKVAEQEPVVEGAIENADTDVAEEVTKVEEVANSPYTEEQTDAMAEATSLEEVGQVAFEETAVAAE